MILSGILAFFLAVLSQSLLPFAHWNAAIPDLAILYLTFLATLQPRRYLPAHAFVIGIVWDLVSGIWIGYHTFSLLVCGIGLEKAQGHLYMNRPKVFFPAVLAGSLVRQAALALLLGLKDAAWLSGFLSYGLSAVLYTFFFALFLYVLRGLLRWVWQSMAA